MPAEHPTTGSPLARLWQWIHGQLVQDVPEDLAVCEFDCRKLQCTMGEWETCERRLERVELQKKPRSGGAPAAKPVAPRNRK